MTNRVGGIANVAKDSMRDKLYDLEIQESKLRARFKDDHPLLVQIQKQREEAENILADLPNERTQTTNALNPNQRHLELELAEAQANDDSLQARVIAAEAQQADVYTQLAALNDHELKITELERDAQLLDGKYRMHVEKLEQARVNDALGRERISNVCVAQSATTPDKPSYPNKAVLLIAGLILATGGALVLAFMAERFDQTLRTTQQVEHESGCRYCFRSQNASHADAAY